MDQPAPIASGNALGTGGVRFGIFEVDLRAGELRKGGVKIKLYGQPFNVLATLLERPGQVVTREELQQKLWAGDTFVDFEHGLNKAINKVREALGDDADNPRFVETLPRRGYRFIVPVESVATSPQASKTDAPPSRQPPTAIDTLAVLRFENASGDLAAERGARTAVSAPRWRRAMPWGVAGLLLIALALLAFVHLRERPAAPAELMRFTIPAPETKMASPQLPFALSPDGRQLAFEATDADGRRELWIRSLASLDARTVPAAESVRITPFFWSPDSRYIASGVLSEFKKVDVSGGPAQTLCTFSGAVLGGTWNREGVILFGTYKGLMRVSENGGVATPMTTIDVSRKEVFHGFPSFLPDGHHFIYLRLSQKSENSGVYIGSLDAEPGEQSLKRLVATNYGPVYVPPSGGGSGHVLFLRGGTLLAQPFDAHRLELTGESVPLAEQVGSFLQYGFFSASTNGEIVYRPGAGDVARLTWFDRQGKALGTAGEPGVYDTISLSPDGTRAFVSRADDPSNSVAETLWLVDFSRGTSTRLTFGSLSATLGTWSPDGSRIIFASNESGEFDLYQKLANGVAPEEVLLKSSDDKFPTSWSRDGRFLLYQSTWDSWDSRKATKPTKEGLWVLPLEGDKKPFLFESTGSNSDEGQFSPDRRLIAYVSNESGRNEIYIRTFSPATTATAAEAGGKWLISTAGGTQPRWRGDGKELYYLAPDGLLMAVDISESLMFHAGAPKPLFRVPSHVGSSSDNNWDVTRDGKRFLFAAESTQGPFTVVLNWPSLLKK